MSNREDMSSDYEYHECEAQDFGQSHGTQHTHAILAVAAGVKELVELLRPLVDTITAKPEPLKLRTDGTGPMPCLAGDPGSNGFRRCMEPYGHDGDHRHRDGLNAGVEYAWTQRHGDVPARPRGDGLPCSALLPGGHGRDRCVMPRGHDGQCSTVEGKRWDAESRVMPKVDPVSTPHNVFPWPVVADIEYGPHSSESGRCTATLGEVRCAYRRDRHYPYDGSAPRVHASEYLDGEEAIWR